MWLVVFPVGVRISKNCIKIAISIFWGGGEIVGDVHGGGRQVSFSVGGEVPSVPH